MGKATTDRRENAARLHAYLIGQGIRFQMRPEPTEDLFFFEAPGGMRGVVSLFATDLGARITVYPDVAAFEDCTRAQCLALVNAGEEIGIYAAAFFTEEGTLTLQYDLVSAKTGIAPDTITRILNDLFTQAETLVSLARRTARAQ